MQDPSNIDPSALPSTRALSIAALVATVVASILVVTVVLPAETGTDPSGVGTWLGLTELGNIKSGQAEPAAAASQDAPASQPTASAPTGETEPYAFRTDELTLTLQPNEGTEVKAIMREGDQLVYSWAADDGVLFFDFHGEPKGAASNVFTSFEKGSEASVDGTFEAPFEGVHGWYWKNQTSQSVTIRLNTSGVYQNIARK